MSTPNPDAGFPEAMAVKEGESSDVTFTLSIYQPFPLSSLSVSTVPISGEDEDEQLLRAIWMATKKAKKKKKEQGEDLQENR